MAGSKGGKHPKSKGKSKSKKSDTTNQKPEVSNSKLDAGQTSNNSANGPRDSKGKIPQINTSFAMNTSRSNYTDDQMEGFLYSKLESLYTNAKGCLLKLGYGMADVERAILNNGYIHGPADLLNNILTNSIAFIEQKVEAERVAFKDMTELYKTMLPTLIDFVIKKFPNMRRSDAMWHLLVRNWGSVPSTTITTHLQSGKQNTLNSSSAAKEVPSELNMESSSKTLEKTNLTPASVSPSRQNIPIITASAQRESSAPVIEQEAFQGASGELTDCSDYMGSLFFKPITGCSYEACLKKWLESNPDDPKITLTVDLVKNITYLEEKVNEQKEWALQKVIDSAKRLSKDLMELKILRMEKTDAERMKNEKLEAEKSGILKVMEAEQSLRNVNIEASFITEATRRLEINNAQIMADTEALELNAAESNDYLNEVLKRERRCMKKLVNIEKHICNVRAQCDEEKQRMLQLQLEVFQAEKEAEEEEIRWRQEIKEKEQMLAILAEETKMVEIRKAKSKAELSKLSHKVEIDSQLAMDEHKRLEDELARLRMSLQSSNVLVEDDKFIYNSIEITSLESNASCGESYFGNRKCMICSQNEVCVVLLPCTHQVLCFHCYDANCSTAKGRCPYCQVIIEQGIRVYGPSC